MRIRTSPVAFLIVAIVTAVAAAPPAEADSQWTAAEVVSTESNLASSGSWVTVDHGGNVHVAWIDSTDYAGAGSDQDVFYKQRLPNGTWTLTEVLSTESTGHCKSVYLGVDGNGNVHAAYSASLDSSTSEKAVYYKMKPNGGQWTAAEVLSEQVVDFSVMDLALAVSESGVVHVVWSLGTLGQEDLYYRMKTAEGVWSAVAALTTNSYSFSPSLAVAGDESLHLAYLSDDSLPSSVRYRHKPAGGIWSAFETVAYCVDIMFETSLAVDANDVLHLVWDDYLDEYPMCGHCLYYMSKPIGGNWSSKEFISFAPFRPRPSVAAGTSRQTYVAWYAGTGDHYEIFCRVKGEMGWSGTQTISTESDTESSTRPCLDMDDLGVVHAAWTDYADYSGAGPDRDIFYKMNLAAINTVSAGITCAPAAGTIPFSTNITVSLGNTYSLFKRRIAARLDVELGGGQQWHGWKSGYTQLDPDESYVRTWNQIIPAVVSMIGPNVFRLSAEDVTPAPFNLPPYMPAGDTATDTCTVTGVAP